MRFRPKIRAPDLSGDLTALPYLLAGLKESTSKEMETEAYF